MMMNQVDDDSTNDILDGEYTLPMTGISVKGELPESGWIKIENGKIADYSIKVMEYTVNKDEEPYKDEEEKEEVPPTPTYGATIVPATNGETYKAIVYLDPSNLSNVCDASNSVSATGTKTGCMKWYAYAEDDTTYTMILDHNTTARIKWNDSNSNVAYESSNLKAVVDDLVTTSGWKVAPRLITASEVNTIVGGVSTWDVTDYNTLFYFEGTGTKNQTLPTYDSSNRSSYDWLYNNLNLCKSDSTDYGCTIEDGNTYTGYGTAGDENTWAYWTSTPLGTAGSGSNVWCVFRSGALYASNTNITGSGVRPVITINKAALN